MSHSGPGAAFSFLIDTLFNFYCYIVLARFLLQIFKADFYNPVSQFVVKATNPILIPLRRIIPGFGERMRSISLQFTPTAILSRQIGGTRGKSLIFNLPGRPKAIRETLDEIWKAVPYCVDLIEGPYIDMNDDVCNAFRPKSARRR